MAVDTSTLTQLITTFKQETREETVTVEVLGSLLQKIVDLLGTTALQSDVASLTAWRTLFAKLNTLVTNISIGSDDRNSIYLSLSKGNVATGSVQSQPDSLCIRQATTERAGAMRAQQVQDLNKCKSDISAINTSLNSLNTSLSKLNTELMRHSRQLTTDANALSSVDTWIKQTSTTISSLQSSIRTLQTNFNTFASMKSTTTIHIECQIKDGKLYIQGADQLIQSGLLPVIFRYSIRTSRYKQNDNGIREYMPKRRGWHRFFDSKKIQVASDNTINFRDDSPYRTINDPIKYDFTPKYLFSFEKVGIDPHTGNVFEVHVPYGQKLFNVFSHPRLFKFAIGFYKPVSNSSTFRFSDLRTNLAIFRVRVESLPTSDGKQTNYYLSR